jgi:hypothetical protein
MYGIHMSLRHHLRGGKVSGFVEKIVDGSSDLDAIEVIKDALSFGQVEHFLKEVGLGLSNLNGTTSHQQTLSDLLVACCFGQAISGDPPKHDGKYVVACLEELDRVGCNASGLQEMARQVRRSAIASMYRRAFEKVHYDRHKLEIIHSFADRSQKFLEEHPWEAHRHDMPRLTLGFTTDSRAFNNRDQLWSCLLDGWFRTSDLQELRELTRETIVDFDFDAWKALHRHFLPGFHIYSCVQFATHRTDCKGFVAAMDRCLEDHYSGRNGARYARPFTPSMKAWVEPYAKHIWQETHVAEAVQELCQKYRKEKDSIGDEDVTVVARRVMEMFPEVQLLEQKSLETRMQHIHVLVREAFSKL